MSTTAEQPKQEFKPDWNGMLEAALTGEPGDLSQYSEIYQYSVGNLAMLMYQGVTPQPCASYQRWREFGRHVKAGASAYYVLRPITIKLKDELDESGQPMTIRRYKPSKSVFPVSMTEGEPLPEIELPQWSRERMLGALAMEMVGYEDFSAATQGYSIGRTIAINPLAKYPEKTFYHEAAHVQLGHTAGKYIDYLKHRGTYETEAESTSLIVTNELGLSTPDGDASSRAYIQSWSEHEGLSGSSVRHIFAAATEILRAGREEHEEVV